MSKYLCCDLIKFVLLNTLYFKYSEQCFKNCFYKIEKLHNIFEVSRLFVIKCCFCAKNGAKKIVFVTIFGQFYRILVFFQK